MSNNNVDFGFFGPDSHMWQNQQYFIRLIFLPIAVIIIMANPIISEIMLKNTSSIENLQSRLSITRKYSFNFIFGDKKTALTAAANLKKTHQQVHHKINGKEYCALDKDLMLWVFASLYYVNKKINKVILRNIPFNQETYIEYKILAQLFGIDINDLPNTEVDFDKYWALALKEQVLVSDETKKFVRSCLKISVVDFYFNYKTPFYLRFLTKHIDQFIRIFCIYCLPKQIASAFNLKITIKQQKRVARLMKCLRFLNSILPKWLTVEKSVRQAFRKASLIHKNP